MAKFGEDPLVIKPLITQGKKYLLSEDFSKRSSNTTIKLGLGLLKI